MFTLLLRSLLLLLSVVVALLLVHTENGNVGGVDTRKTDKDLRHKHSFVWEPTRSSRASVLQRQIVLPAEAAICMLSSKG